MTSHYQFNSTHVTATEIAKKLGTSALKIGEILTELGYKNGDRFTDKAFFECACIRTRNKEGRTVLLWQWNKLLPKIVDALKETK